MEFLKEVLGETLYRQVEEAINAHNGNEANKDKQVKLANLSSGEYVGKGKFDALQAELDTANGLLDQLKKENQGSEQLQQELRETKINAAVQVGLLAEKALDVDFLTFQLMSQLKAEGRKLQLDENGGIQGWKELVSTLKQQFPSRFEGKKIFLEGKLPPVGGDGAVTLEQFRKMGVAERSKLKAENESLYNEYRGK